MSNAGIKNKLTASVGAYTLVNIVNKGIPFLLLPLLTHYLSTEDYGILTNLESLLTITITLIGVNMSSAITRQYVKEDVNLKDYFMSALRVVLISFFVVTLLFGSFANWIYEFTAIPIEIIYFVSLYAVLDSLMEVVLTIWRMEHKPFYYGALRIARTVIEVLISVILVIVYKYDWFGRFTGIYVAGVLGGLFALFYLIKKGYFKGKFKKEHRIHFLKYGLPLIPHSISGVLIFYSDKLVITKMLGIEANGIYSVAFTIGMAISLLQNSFNQGWVPWLYKKLALNTFEEKKKLVKITYIYMIVMLIFVFLLWLLTPLIYYFLGQDFKEGMSLVVIIGLGFAFNGMYKMMVNYIFYSEKTSIISVITIGMALLNIGLNIIFIREWNLVGSAYASALTFFVQFIVTWYVSNKVCPMPWFKLK